MATRSMCWCWWTRPAFPGCVMQVRPIGVLEMLDQGIPDEKILAVGKNNPRYTDVWNYSEIYPHMLKEITHFFSIYKDLEGKRVEIKGWKDAEAGRRAVTDPRSAMSKSREERRERRPRSLFEERRSAGSLAGFAHWRMRSAGLVDQAPGSHKRPAPAAQ